MSPKVDIVTQEKAKDSKILLGIQVGFLGLIVRIGLYKDTR